MISVPDGTKICFQNGINGFTRALILTDLLIKEYHTTYPDVIMMVGDIASNEASYFYDTENMEDHIWYKLKNSFFSKLDKEEIPWFFVYANHDDFTDEEFGEVFNYTKNFVLRINEEEALVPAFDHYATPNPEDDKWGYGAKSESNPVFLRLVKTLDGSCRDTIIYTHYSSHAGENFLDFIKGSSHVRAALQGHSHYHHGRHILDNAAGDAVWTYEIGNFSWNADTFGHAGIKLDGSVRTVGDIEEDDNTYFAGSFSFTYVDSDVQNGERSLEYYFVYPEMQYGALGGSGGRYTTGRRLEPFYQERYSTKGEESSGGNRRYAKFPV